jgi:hypothetical protein
MIDFLINGNHGVAFTGGVIAMLIFIWSVIAFVLFMMFMFVIICAVSII